MRRHFLILVLLIGACFVAKAQEEDFDVTKHIADTKAFTFDDGKNTVRGYLSAKLTEKTKCCGKDRIYLEIKIDPTGNVLHAKAITGTNECIKRSAEDIVKSIKWDAAEFRGPTSKYLEIRPDIECTDDKDNSYTQIEVFNNDLLGPDGNPKTSNSNPVANTTPPAKETPTVSTPPAKEESKEVAKTEPQASKEEGKAPKEEVKEAVVAENTSPTRSSSEEASSTNTSREEETADEAVEEATADTNPVKKAQEEEVIALREQLAEMRRQEIEKRRKEAAIERRKREQERRKQEAIAAKNTSKDQFSTGSSDLYAEDPYADTGAEGFGAGSTDIPQDEKIADEIARLKTQIAELAAANQERDAQVKASIEEAKQTNQEIIRIQEEIVAKEEEKERYREEQELAQIEEEKAQAEEARRAEEEAYQRMMDEIKRLQEEADAKIAELEAKKKEVDRMAALKKMREQEIALERALRDKEAQASLAEARLSLQASGTPVVNLASDNSSIASSDLMALLPDLTTEVDSEKLAVLIQTIQTLQLEVQRLQEQIALMEGNPRTVASNSSPKSDGNTRSQAQSKKPKSDGLQRADENTSYKGIDYKQPGMEDSPIYTSVKNEQPPVNNSGSQGNPPIKNSGKDQKTGTHENSAGPKFEPREYVGGKAAMKQLIKSELKESGVCGLAQSVFSVTLNSSGKVTSSRVLAANSTDVQLKLPNIINQLKFNQVETRIPQTIYLEFKAEILCDENDKVNLREVKDIIKE